MGWILRWLRGPHEHERPIEQSREDGVSPELFVPRAVVSDTHQHLVPYWKAGVEAACYWFGIETTEASVVTTLALPEVLQSSGNYLVVRDSLRRLSKDMRSQGLVNLAQIHTHPGGWVGHSPYDDEHAYSTRDGSLSLVWPDYGHVCTHNLVGIGVHERRDGKWEEFTEEEVGRRIKVIDSLSDHRWKISQGDLKDEE